MATTLAVKYRPTNFSDVSSQVNTISILEHQLKTNNLKNAYLFSGASGCGKALRRGTLIYTNRGLVAIENLTMNDKVLGTDGKFYSLEGIFPQGKREVYRVSFDCGMHRDCDIEHLWEVIYKGHKVVVKTEELINILNNCNNRKRPYLQIPKPYEINRIDKIDPELFLLFAIYGEMFYDLDDKCYWYYLSVPNDRVLKLLNTVCDRYNFQPELIRGKNKCGKRGKLFRIRENNIIDRKWIHIEYIPHEFIFTNIHNRKKFYDTMMLIGYGNYANFRLFSIIHYEFMKGVQNILHSLGYKTNLLRSGGIYRLYMPKKSVHSSKVWLGNIRIRSVQSLGFEDEMICIKVNNDNHLFVIDGYIPTHNTTVARILANKVNNDKCKPIELDAASNNGIDDVRQIIDDARFKNISGEYKVYIIDECHSITSQAWQAFLKILEEPPAKTIFIFCTTEPHKLPRTILNRLQRFDFYRMTKDDIVNRLLYILEKEGIKEYEIEAIEYIARVSFGGMRDAITYLDKVLLCSDKITLTNTVKALSLCEYDLMFDIIKNIDNTKELLEIIERVHMDGRSLKNFIEMLIAFVIDFIKLQIGLDFDNVSIPKTYINFDYSNTKDLRPFLSGLVKLNNVLKYESNPKMVIEAFFIEVSVGCIK